jgi:hypothetical protein
VPPAMTTPRRAARIIRIVPSRCAPLHLGPRLLAAYLYGVVGIRSITAEVDIHCRRASLLKSARSFC